VGPIARDSDTSARAGLFDIAHIKQHCCSRFTRADEAACGNCGDPDAAEGSSGALRHWGGRAPAESGDAAYAPGGNRVGSTEISISRRRSARRSIPRTCEGVHQPPRVCRAPAHASSRSPACCSDADAERLSAAQRHPGGHTPTPGGDRADELADFPKELVVSRKESCPLARTRGPRHPHLTRESTLDNPSGGAPAHRG